MPQIIVTAGHTAGEGETTVLLRERVNASDFESERFAENLVERLGWAVLDAAEAEAAQAEERDTPEPAERPKRRPITGERERESYLEPVGSA